MPTREKKTEFEVVADIVSQLQNLDKETQVHILTTVCTYLRVGFDRSGTRGVSPTPSAPAPTEQGAPKAPAPFSGRPDMSPKEFLLQKEPRTDLQRIGCLAYYLTHYRDTPAFRSIELSKLNTEAAQRKFANAANTAKNAVKCGLFVPASKKGYRQLSGAGEQYIDALPDREKARAAYRRMRPSKSSAARRRVKRPRDAGKGGDK